MSKNNVLSKSTKELIEESLAHAASYNKFRETMTQLALEGRSTGDTQSEALSNYTLLNDRRMKRLDKTIVLDDESVFKIQKLNKKIIWVVLTESWCADAAQTMPIMNKVVEHNSHIDLKIILRDENLELMNRFMYNNTLSIPKLIMVDRETGEVMGDWGPRPTPVNDMVEKQKKKYGKLTAEFKKELQVWYNKDKGQTTLNDLMELLTLKNVGDGSNLLRLVGVPTKTGL